MAKKKDHRRGQVPGAEPRARRGYRGRRFRGGGKEPTRDTTRAELRRARGKRQSLGTLTLELEKGSCSRRFDHAQNRLTNSKKLLSENTPKPYPLSTPSKRSSSHGTHPKTVPPKNILCEKGPIGPGKKGDLATCRGGGGGVGGGKLEKVSKRFQAAGGGKTSENFLKGEKGCTTVLESRNPCKGAQERGGSLKGKGKAVKRNQRGTDRSRGSRPHI